MTRSTLTLASSIIVAAVIALSGCGANVDKVEEAVGSPETTTSIAGKDATSTTSRSDTTRRATTTLPDRSASTNKDAAPYVQAMADSMLDDDDDLSITEDQALCFAGRSIEIIGVDRLQSKGITPDDLRDDSALDLSDVGLTMDEGNALYDSFEDCDIDLRALMLDSMGEDEEVPAAAKACLEQVFSEDNLRKLMVTTIVKGDDAVENDPDLEQITGGMVGCMFMAMSPDTTSP